MVNETDAVVLDAVREALPRKLNVREIVGTARQLHQQCPTTGGDIVQQAQRQREQLVNSAAIRRKPNAKSRAAGSDPSTV